MIDWNSSLKVASVAKIDVRLHWSMFVAAAFLLVTARYGSHYAMVCFVLTMIILLHEFGHAFMAKYLGLAATKIVLYPIGGLAYTGVSLRPRDNALVSAAGPAVNIAIALIILVTMVATNTPIEVDMFNPFSFYFGHSLLENIFGLNGLMILVNTAPIHPLDGGRVLLSLLSIKNSPNRSMSITATVSKIGSSLMALIGVGTQSIFLIGAGAWLLSEAYGLQKRAKTATKKTPKTVDDNGQPTIDWEELCRGRGLFQTEIFAPEPHTQTIKLSKMTTSSAQASVDKILKELRDHKKTNT